LPTDPGPGAIAVTLDKIDLIDRKFSQSLLGYRRDEVDRLVAEAAEAIGRLAEEKMTLARTVEELRRELGEYRGREATLRDTLLTTQKIVEDLKADARQEAERILDEARDGASAMIRESGERAVALGREIDALRLRKTALATRFHEMLLSSLDILDTEFSVDATEAGERERAGSAAGLASEASEDFTFKEPAGIDTATGK
jgi:cell division initiation protein